MKRITALFLALAFTALAAFPVLATGGEAGSLSHFSRRLTYTPGMFSDADENAWYGTNRQGCVKTVYELGIMDGMGDGSFLPGGNIRLSEIIKMAAVVHSIYTGDKTDFSGAVPWYQSYVNYSVENGIIKEGQYYDYTAYATRSDVAYIFSGSLPEAEFAAVNTVNSIPDVNTSVLWYQQIFLLYRAGVLSGDEQTRNYRPTERCSRAEAAAIIARVASPAARLRFDILTYNADPGDHYPDFAIANAGGDHLALGHQAAGAVRAFFGAAPETTQVWTHSKDINLVSSAFVGAPDVRYLNSANAESGIYIFSLGVTSAEYKMPGGIGVGSTAEELKAAFGEGLSYEAASPGSFWEFDEAYTHTVYKNGQILTASFQVDEGLVIRMDLFCALH